MMPMAWELQKLSVIEYVLNETAFPESNTEKNPQPPKHVFFEKSII